MATSTIPPAESINPSSAVIPITHLQLIIKPPINPKPAFLPVLTPWLQPSHKHQTRDPLCQFLQTTQFHRISPSPRKQNHQPKPVLEPSLPWSPTLVHQRRRCTPRPPSIITDRSASSCAVAVQCSAPLCPVAPPRRRQPEPSSIPPAKPLLPCAAPVRHAQHHR